MISPWSKGGWSTLDFERPNAARVALPDTSAYEPPDHARHPDYVPMPPAQQELPVQERGLPYARALPYELQADGSTHAAGNAFRIDFANTGAAGATPSCVTSARARASARAGGWGRASAGTTC